MTRPEYLNMPFEAPQTPRTANGAVPLLTPRAEPPAGMRPSPVAEFVSEVMTGRFDPPPLPQQPAPVSAAAHAPGPHVPAAPIVERRAIPPFKMAPDSPPARVSQDSTEALLQAIDKVYRVVKDRIAWHEDELKKLRAALSPFGAIEAPPSDTSVNTAESFIQSLVQAANGLQETTK